MRPASKFKNRLRGIVLLIVLAILSLLSVLCVSFVGMARLERNLSASYVDRTRALMAAESGVETAIARLRLQRGMPLISDEYDDMQYNFRREDSASWDRVAAVAASLETARYSSFARIDDAGVRQRDGGSISSSYTRDGDYFTLRVVDTSGRINLNDSNGQLNYDDDMRPDDATDPADDQAGAPYRLQRLVVNLCDILFDNPLLAVEVGSRLYFDPVTGRGTFPGDRFPNWTAVDAALTAAGLDGDQKARFLACVTLQSWQDPDVIRPTAQYRLTYSQDPATVAYWPDDTSTPEDFEQYGMKYTVYGDVQTRAFALEPRSPVNVNGACREVLQALFWGVDGCYHNAVTDDPSMMHSMTREQMKGRGVYRDNLANYFWEGGETEWWAYPGYADLFSYAPINTGGRTGLPFGSYMGCVRKSIALDRLKSERLAAALWDRVHGIDSDGDGFPAAGEAPDPVESWSEFREFLNANMDSVGFDEFQRDALLANFNPNSRLNDYVPSRSFRQEIDKAELRSYTTEFCFGPTGLFEIFSLGAISRTDGTVAARAQVEAVVRLFHTFRQTTQAQFLSGWDARIPGDEYRFFNESASSFFTAGAELEERTGLLSGRTGVAMQSYPEPLRREGSNLDVPLSAFEGYLQLATWQIQYPLPEASFQVSFDGRLRPSRWGQNPATTLDNDDYLPTGYDDYGSGFNVQADQIPGFSFVDYSYWEQWKLTAIDNNPTDNALTPAGVSDDVVPGILYPDGAYSDAGRTLGYRTANFGSRAILPIHHGEGGTFGGLQAWVKPNFWLERPTRPRMIFSMNKVLGDQVEKDMMFVAFMPQADTFLKMYGPGPDNPYYVYFCGDPTLPTRSLAFGMHLIGNQYNTSTHIWDSTLNAYSTVSTTVNHRYTGGEGPPPPGDPSYDMESYAWNHVAISWNAETDDPFLRQTLLINGSAVMANHGDWHNIDFQTYTPHEMWNPLDEPHYLRLGEMATYPFWNYCGDSVFDEVVGFLGYHNETDILLTTAWEAGRYFNDADANGNNGVYTSPELNLYDSLGVNPKWASLTLKNVSWTAYLPRYNRRTGLTEMAWDEFSVSSPAFNENDPSDPMAGDWGGEWDPICVDVSTATEDGFPSYWFEGERERMFTYAGGSVAVAGDGASLLLDPHQPFVYQVYMNVDPGQTLYESPVFDDITFQLELSAPEILSWNAGR